MLRSEINIFFSFHKNFGGLEKDRSFVKKLMMMKFKHVHHGYGGQVGCPLA